MLDFDIVKNICLEYGYKILYDPKEQKITVYNNKNVEIKPVKARMYTSKRTGETKHEYVYWLYCKRDKKPQKDYSVSTLIRVCRYTGVLKEDGCYHIEKED